MRYFLNNKSQNAHIYKYINSLADIAETAIFTLFYL